MFEIYVARDEDTLEKWQEFKEAFKENHFLIGQKFTIIEEHLNTILSDEGKVIETATQFYRARVNRQNSKPYTANELNMPPADKVGHGRLNPKGIPYLYLASNQQTAIKEVRANYLDIVDIAKCEFRESVYVIDLMKEDTSKKIHSFRRIISQEFSKPVKSSLSELEYLPTQYIAEYMKNKGVEGVLYQSAVNPSGYNICLFKNDSVQLECFKQVEIKDVPLEP